MAAIKPQAHNKSSAQCGCGIVFGTDSGGGLICRSLVPGGSADMSGLVDVGDVLTSVGGVDVFKRPPSDVAPLLLGPAGSHVRLGIIRQNLRVEIELVRQPVARDASMTAMLRAVNSDPNPLTFRIRDSGRPGSENVAPTCEKIADPSSPYAHMYDSP